MTTATQTVTLNDYANARDGVVLFATGTGNPYGEHFPLGHPDLDFADRRNLLDLAGTVDAQGDWQWDGDGNPTDDHSNSLTRLTAFASTAKWKKIVDAYEAGE